MDCCCGGGWLVVDVHPYVVLLYMPVCLQTLYEHIHTHIHSYTHPFIHTFIHNYTPHHFLTQGAAVSAVRECDMLLTQLASLIPIDIMPGPNDPANCSLPQQPLHRCLLPGASRFDTVQRVTNPHAFDVEGVTVLGTSGQNIDDIYKYGGVC